MTQTQARRPLDELKPREILAAVETLMDTEFGCTAADWQFWPRVAEFLGSGTNATGDASGYAARTMQEAFAARVDRALGKLAGEGKLRKVPRHTAGPDGSSDRFTRFYTPAAWDAAAAGVARERAAQAKADEMWAGIEARMSGQGFPLGPDHRLSAGQFLELCTLLEARR